MCVCVCVDLLVLAASSSVSQDAINFIEQLLEIDPKKRLDVIQALAHPWLAEDIHI